MIADLWEQHHWFRFLVVLLIPIASVGLVVLILCYEIVFRIAYVLYVAMIIFLLFTALWRATA